MFLFQFLFFFFQLGIGSVWREYNLINSETPQCVYPFNSAASREYRFISGCTSRAVPIENRFGPGSACSHWANDCFQGREVMASISTESGLTPVSLITIGTLDDMGYAVDYNRRDFLSPFDLSSSCRCVRRNLQAGEEGPEEEEDEALARTITEHEISQELFEEARRVGLELLNQNSLLYPLQASNGRVTQPGTNVLVLVRDPNTGSIHEVIVTND